MPELPKTKVPAKSKNPRVLILYGMPKVGKTTVLSQLEDTLIIDLEQGSDFLEALKVNVDSLKELHEVGEQIKAEGKPYKRVAIDTITKLEELAEEAATNMYKRSPQGKSFIGKSVLELPNGGGYLYLRQAYKHWIDYIYTLADEIILIGHIKEKMLSGVGVKTGQEVASKDLDLTGKIKSIACAKADAIGYLYRRDGELFVSFTNNEEDITAGCRAEHLIGFDGPFSWGAIYK